MLWQYLIHVFSEMYNTIVCPGIAAANNDNFQIQMSRNSDYSKRHKSGHIKITQTKNIVSDEEGE